MIENEGIYSTGKNLYGCWVTLDTPDWVNPAFAGEGIAITLEMSSKPNRIDFSDIVPGFPAPYNSVLFEATIHFSSVVGVQLLEPITRDTIDSFVDIIDMMRDLNMSNYSFSGENRTLIDGLAASVPTAGNLFECKSLDGQIFSITVTVPLISREYWFTGAMGNTQVTKNFAFTP